MPVGTTLEHLRIYIPSFGSESNIMLSEFEITNLTKRYRDLKFVKTD